MPCQLPSTFCPFGFPYCNLAVVWQLKSSSVFMTPDRQLNLPVSSLCFVFAGFCAQPARPLHYPIWKTDLIEGDNKSWDFRPATCYCKISGSKSVIGSLCLQKDFWDRQGRQTLQVARGRYIARGCFDFQVIDFGERSSLFSLIRKNLGNVDTREV